MWRGGCCGPVSKKIIYKCADEDCSSTQEFDKEPKKTPICCGKPMKKSD
ncbi:MAG: hypothetical protein Q8O13_06385 [Candidatus Omnitrophota bacterium]|nr:hypothetical protein [Candidatus Omnitrophota bacterium]